MHDEQSEISASKRRVSDVKRHLYLKNRNQLLRRPFKIFYKLLY